MASAVTNSTPISRLSLRARLGHAFGSLSFRTKFLTVGLLIAGPLLALMVFSAATLHERARLASYRVAALKDSIDVRKFMIAVALHRGLSASVLAGAESLSSRLVAHQRVLTEQLSAMRQARDDAAWTALGIADFSALQEELGELMRLPHGNPLRSNFERHSAVIDMLRVALARIGTGVGRAQSNDTPLHDVVFISLPAFAEDLGRQRGWGSAVLAQGAFSDAEMSAYLMEAGAALRHVRTLRADRETLRQADAVLKTVEQSSPLRSALDSAESFSWASVALVTRKARADNAANDHFREGSNAIDGLSRLGAQITAVLQARAQTALDTAQRDHNRVLGALALLVLLLVFVYAGFARSTVIRLRALDGAALRVRNGDFERRIEVAGSDELASLAASLDEMRVGLQVAVRDRSAGIAAEMADRAKTEFLARWSHDLRTPLNAVLGFTDVLEFRRGAALQAEEARALQNIRQAAQHLLRLVVDVLDMTSLQGGHMPVAQTPVCVPSLVADVADMLGQQAAVAGVVVDVSVPADAWVSGDHTRLVQVLSNLVSNGIKFNRPGGRVAIRADVRGDAVVVEVTDNGPGIAAKDLARLFRAFDRLDAEARQIPGTGLGLALAKALTEAMGGSIAVASAPGRGTTFTLSFRSCAAPAAASLAAPAAGPRAERLVGAVAYVEDDAVNGLLMSEMLRLASDIHLHVFTSASLAQEAARRMRFDLWIIDRQLPDGEGVDLLRSMRAVIGPDVPAVMLSADASGRSRERALAAGFAAFWTKPIALHALLQGLSLYLRAAPRQ